MNNWNSILLPITSTIAMVIGNLNESQLKIVIIISKEGELEGTVSDGDVRRGLLKGYSLNDSVEKILHRDAIIAPKEMTEDIVIMLMKANKIQQVPIVDSKRRVIGVHIWDLIYDIQKKLNNTIVIMAGGFGKRLLPFTLDCPKPMLLIRGKPMLEHIIDKAKSQGFTNFIISIHYLGHLIEEHFGDGSGFGVNIKYIKENKPLGTAGSLSLLDIKSNEPFIVTNGDLITEINYNSLIEYHLRHRAIATMAVSEYEWQNPFGVVKLNGFEIMNIDEKPISKSHINAGVYVFNRSIFKYLVNNCYCDIPSLFEKLRNNGEYTVAYPIHEVWNDVGVPEDYLNINKNL
jgi:dTDP-glucose pyrophosphorylase